MDNIVVFGGTFNPIHNGHLRLYRHFADTLGAERVLLIPSRVPPHKEPVELADGKARLALCRLATVGDPRVRVCELELRREAPSYTADTLRELTAIYPGAPLYLLVGSDMLLTLDSWHEADEIMRLATVCALARHSHEQDALLQKAAELEQRFGGCFLIDKTPPLELSSTELRRKLKEGEDCSAFLPAAVEDYIKRTGMYQKLE